PEDAAARGGERPRRRDRAGRRPAPRPARGGGVTDPLVSFREEITSADLELLELVNRRVELVRRLHEYKLAEGLPLRDPGREEALVRELQEHNAGPLSDVGVESLFRFVLDLTREEVHGG